MAAENIDTRVSPALDPMTYTAVEAYNDDTRQFVDVVVNAFNDIYQTVGKAHDILLSEPLTERARTAVRVASSSRSR